MTMRGQMGGGTKLEKIYANARKMLKIKESNRKYSNLIIDINL